MTIKEYEFKLVVNAEDEDKASDLVFEYLEDIVIRSTGFGVTATGKEMEDDICPQP